MATRPTPTETSSKTTKTTAAICPARSSDVVFPSRLARPNRTQQSSAAAPALRLLCFHARLKLSNACMATVTMDVETAS